MTLCGIERVGLSRSTVLVRERMPVRRSVRDRQFPRLDMKELYLAFPEAEDKQDGGERRRGGGYCSLDGTGMSVQRRYFIILYI